MSALQFDVIGADGPKTYFGRLTRESIAHGYLFSGPPGVGKKTFARRLAQSLLCENARDGVLGYDGTCAACKLFSDATSARHPDFLEHVGVLKIGDSDAALGFYESEELTARDLVRQLSMQSYSGGMRVLLLGDLDFATHHAANALLKFFEEPPRGVVLIVTSSAPGRLLTTIRSRLIELHFAPLTKAQANELAGRRGSVRDEDENAFKDSVVRWFVCAVRGETPDESWALRETLDDGLEIVKTLVRDWTALGVAGDAIALAPAYAEELRRLPPVAAADALGMLAKLDDAQRLARTNVSPALVADMVRMAITGTATRV